MRIMGSSANRGPVGDWLNKMWMDWERREGERKSQVQLAEYLGIDRAMLNQYLNGKRVPTPAHQEKIAVKFGLEIYMLMGRIPPELMDLARLYARLPVGDRAAFRDQLQTFLRSVGFERVE